jgi:hypothetical protein
MLRSVMNQEFSLSCRYFLLRGLPPTPPTSLLILFPLVPEFSTSSISPSRPASPSQSNKQQQIFLCDFDSNILHPDYDIKSYFSNALRLSHVKYYVVPSSTLRESHELIHLKEEYQDQIIGITAGVHPYHTQASPSILDQETRNEFETLIQSKKFCAVVPFPSHSLPLSLRLVIG